MSWLGKLRNVVTTAGDMTAIPNIRNFMGRVEPANSSSDRDSALLKGDRFEPERSYFGRVPPNGVRAVGK
jgi:hypothetical protein